MSEPHFRQSQLDSTSRTRKDVETVIHSDSDFATVAYLRVKDAELENKSPTEEYELPIPRHLEERYEELLEDEAYDEPPNLDTLSLKEPVPVDSIDSEVIAFPTQSHRVGNWVSVSNIQQTQDSRQTFSIEEEVSACFQILKGMFTLPPRIHVPRSLKVPDELQKYDLEIHHCANINIFLSSMDLFARVNEVYGSFFGTSPPARACVAVALPQGTRVRLDVVAFTEQKPGERHAHHVQGLSYWAPANIGPYSQAIMVSSASTTQHLSMLGLSSFAVIGSRTSLCVWSNRAHTKQSDASQFSTNANCVGQPTRRKDLGSPCKQYGFQLESCHPTQHLLV